MHKALTQAACTISMYSYVLYATGAVEKIDSVFEGIESLSKGHGQDGDGGLEQIIQNIRMNGVTVISRISNYNHLLDYFYVFVNWMKEYILGH